MTNAPGPPVPVRAREGHSFGSLQESRCNQTELQTLGKTPGEVMSSIFSAIRQLFDQCRRGGSGQPSPLEGAILHLHRALNATRQELEDAQATNDVLTTRCADMTRQLDVTVREYKQLEGRMSMTKLELHSCGEDKAQTKERLCKAKVLLACETRRREEAEQEGERCKTLLEAQTACRLLGGGINIQGDCLTLPEIEAEIRQTLTITGSEWVENANFALSEFVQSGWGVPKYLSEVFILCKEIIDCSRERYVDIFLGRVEGANEANMDPSAANFMRQHMRRHYLTLFPLAGNAFHEACRKLGSSFGRMIAKHVGSDACPERITRALVASGLEKVVARYLNILVGCAMQHPPVQFSGDCMEKQLFNTKTHAEPIDGDSLGQDCECMIVFPALLVKKEEVEWEPLTKRFVLGIQETQA